MTDMSLPLHDPQVTLFMAAFPEARLDPTAIAESFKETPECAPATRVIRLNALHRALPRQARISLNSLAKAYQFAPCLATLQADRLLGKISGADALFGEGQFLPLFLQEPEKFAQILQYNAGDFISLGLNCSRALKKLNLPATALRDMVIREPKLLGLEPTTLSAHLVDLAEQALAADAPETTLATLQTTLLEHPSTLLEPNKNLSFYLEVRETKTEEIKTEEIKTEAPSITPEVALITPAPAPTPKEANSKTDDQLSAPKERKNTRRPRATANAMDNGIAATLAAAQAFKKALEEPSLPKTAPAQTPIQTPTEVNIAPQADAPKPPEKDLAPPAPKPAPNSPKKALNAKAHQRKTPPSERKLSTAGVISGSLAFASLQGAFSGQPKAVTRSDLARMLIKKI